MILFENMSCHLKRIDFFPLLRTDKFQFFNENQNSNCWLTKFHDGWIIQHLNIGNIIWNAKMECIEVDNNGIKKLWWDIHWKVCQFSNIIHAMCNLSKISLDGTSEWVQTIYWSHTPRQITHWNGVQWVCFKSLA